MAKYLVTANFPAPVSDPTKPFFVYSESPRSAKLAPSKSVKLGRPFSIAVKCRSASLAKNMQQVFKNLGAEVSLEPA